jgi:ABC-2 type transport system permease protein
MNRVLASTIWQRELVEFLLRPRALAIKLIFPLVVALPLVFSSAPAFYAAMALTMLVAVVGALGSGAVLSRERTAGVITRYRLLPRRAGAVVLERLSANAGIDFLQMLPVMTIIGIRHPHDAIWWPALAFAVAAVLLAGNVIGAWASTISDSPGEVMLAVFLPLLPALFLSEVFVPLQPPLLEVSRVLPFTYLHDALLGALNGSAQLNPLSDLAGAVGFLAVALAAGALLSRRILESD